MFGGIDKTSWKADVDKKILKFTLTAICRDFNPAMNQPFMKLYTEVHGHMTLDSVNAKILVHRSNKYWRPIDHFIKYSC